jgi:hypothetical protein
MKRKGYENSAQRRVLIEMGSVQIEGLRCRGLAKILEHTGFEAERLTKLNHLLD